MRSATPRRPRYLSQARSPYRNVDKNCYSEGLTRRCHENFAYPVREIKSDIIIDLAGRAAEEMVYGDPGMNSDRDIREAFHSVLGLLCESCIGSFRYHSEGENDSQMLRAGLEKAAAEEIEKYYAEAMQILSENREFFEKLRRELYEKKIITAVDVECIRRSCEDAPAAM